MRAPRNAPLVRHEYDKDENAVENLRILTVRLPRDYILASTDR